MRRPSQDRCRQRPDRRSPEQIDDHDEAARLQPVHQRPAEQREDQPGQLLGEKRTGDQQPIMGNARRQERPSRDGDPITGHRHRVGHPQPPVIASERTTFPDGHAGR